MKNNRLIFSLLSAALIALPAVAYAGEPRFNLLCVYKLANGQGVAIALPDEWQELSKTRAVEPGAPVRFLDESGRTVEVSATVLERASKARSVVWPEEYGRTRVAKK
jgi:hypothetical protein